MGHSNMAGGDSLCSIAAERYPLGRFQEHAQTLSGVVTSVRSIVFRCSTAALLVGMVVVSREGAAQGITVSARISGGPLFRTGPDSGKVALSLEIIGLPPIPQAPLPRDMVKLVDEAGRTYTPWGIAIQPIESTGVSLAGAYLRAHTTRSSTPRYLFAVPPGTTRFELQLPSIRPVRFTASVKSEPRGNRHD